MPIALFAQHIDLRQAWSRTRPLPPHCHRCRQRQAPCNCAIALSSRPKPEWHRFAAPSATRAAAPDSQRRMAGSRLRQCRNARHYAESLRVVRVADYPATTRSGGDRRAHRAIRAVKTTALRG
jgi:hypothetical protein